MAFRSSVDLWSLHFARPLLLALHSSAASEQLAGNLANVSLDSQLDFMHMAIVPSAREFLHPEEGRSLPLNKISYASLDEYLGTHFLLLRHDFIQPLRQGAENYKLGNPSGPETRIYTNVSVLGVHLSTCGLQLRLRFGQSYNYTARKQLMFGSLLCISCDGFRNLMWGVVSGCHEVRRGLVDIQLVCGGFEQFHQQQRFVMLEATGAYFGAYSHVLKCLQRPDMKDLPFQEHLIFLEPNLRALELNHDNNYEDRQVWISTLDESQKRALKHGLSKGLALIQGPPGTGKTHLSLLIVETLLARMTGRDCGPILVVCYTNHALDQFLEGVLKKEPNIVRVGRGCGSDVLENRLLHKFRVRSRARTLARSECNLLTGSIWDCLGRARGTYVTERGLKGMATKEQLMSLFDPWEENPVEAWLGGESGAENFQDACVELENDESDNEDFQEENEHTPESDAEDFQAANERTPDDDAMSLEDALARSDVWSIPVEVRRRVHDYWLKAMQERNKQQLEELGHAYNSACQAYAAADSDCKLRILRRAKVVGMTTTAAARFHDILVELKPEVVVVEEAAEVLESHILSCLTPHTKHVLLVGDHMQLRPSVATYELATDHKLDVSLFERLVQGGIEHVTLETQRRMKPCISKLVSSIYPSLRNHPSVLEYEDVKGVKSSLFFFHHEAPESSSGSSKVNEREAEMIVRLCGYLLQQENYEPADITVLAMYKRQVEEIIRRMKEEIPGSGCRRYRTQAQLLPRVTSVDDYQGEENKIILLSLVRNNKSGNIGFLRTPNRVCVALSRAKLGLFIFGNAEMMVKGSSLWRSILVGMDEDGLVGDQLRLCCPHKETPIKVPDDFEQVKDGGCDKPCGFQLDCRHYCPKRCHPRSHEGLVCIQPCSKQLESCSHLCQEICHGDDCPPCKTLVEKLILDCGHVQVMKCSSLPESSACKSPCQKLLLCGHNCTNACGKECTTMCAQKVTRSLPCGHVVEALCSSEETAVCTEPVMKELPCGHQVRVACSSDTTSLACLYPVMKELRCGHKVEVPCSNDPAVAQCKEPVVRDLQCGHAARLPCCRKLEEHPCSERCNREMPCGHNCEAKCSSSTFLQCSTKCQNRCTHQSCQLECQDLCKPCLEPCGWKCSHYRCSLRCHQICDRPRCNHPCKKTLAQCGHPCIGVCGEICPSKCRECHPKTMDALTGKRLHETSPVQRFIQLSDCGHVFEVTALDSWMDDEGEAANEISLKKCPECQTPIRISRRYASLVKKKLLQVEQLKRRVLGEKLMKLGMEKLKRKDIRAAKADFQSAIRIHQGLIGAHLGIACVFLSKPMDLQKAIAHLRFVVAASPLGKDADSIIAPRDNRAAYRPVPRNNPGSVEVDSVSEQVASQALIKCSWAMAKLCFKDEAAKLCDIVLNSGPENHHQEAALLKNKIRLSVRSLGKSPDGAEILEAAELCTAAPVCHHGTHSY